MPCCLGCIALIFPRIALVVMWITGYGGRAFEGVLWPLLGFFFMPYTACAYAVAINEFGAIEGWGLALLIVGVVFDLGNHGNSARTTRKYQKVEVQSW